VRRRGQFQRRDAIADPHGALDVRGKDAQPAFQCADVAIAGSGKHQPQPFVFAAIEKHPDEPVDAIGLKEIAEKVGLIEFLARQYVIAVDDAAVAIAHEPLRPGVAAGIDRRVDFLNACGETGCGDEACARRIIPSHRMNAASQLSGQRAPVIRANVSFQLSGWRTES
jgi:hypothetical protein